MATIQGLNVTIAELIQNISILQTNSSQASANLGFLKDNFTNFQTNQTNFYYQINQTLNTSLIMLQVTTIPEIVQNITNLQNSISQANDNFSSFIDNFTNFQTKQTNLGSQISQTINYVNISLTGFQNSQNFSNSQFNIYLQIFKYL